MVGVTRLDHLTSPAEELGLLALGETVVLGEDCLSFCLKLPAGAEQLSQDALASLCAVHNIHDTRDHTDTAGGAPIYGSQLGAQHFPDFTFCCNQQCVFLLGVRLLHSTPTVLDELLQALIVQVAPAKDGRRPGVHQLEVLSELHAGLKLVDSVSNTSELFSAVTAAEHHGNEKVGTAVGLLLAWDRKGDPLTLL